jgi:hypothetical protein
MLTLLPSPAEPIPLFARRYKMICTTYHVAFPELSSFGEAFAGNGTPDAGRKLKGTDC